MTWIVVLVIVFVVIVYLMITHNKEDLERVELLRTLEQIRKLTYCYARINDLYKELDIINSTDQNQRGLKIYEEIRIYQQIRSAKFELRRLYGRELYIMKDGQKIIIQLDHWGEIAPFYKISGNGLDIFGDATFATGCINAVYGDISGCKGDIGKAVKKYIKHKHNIDASSLDKLIDLEDIKPYLTDLEDIAYV
jgi:hypothetical protein